MRGEINFSATAGGHQFNSPERVINILESVIKCWQDMVVDIFLPQAYHFNFIKVRVMLTSEITVVIEDRITLQIPVGVVAAFTLLGLG